MAAEPTILITLDVDWAADWMIEIAAQTLVERGVKATWFITHASPALNALKNEPLFELGWHPNFLPDSSHGDTPEAILTFCKDLVPDARSVRTHSLCQSERHLSLMTEAFNIKNDCSIYMPIDSEIVPHGVRYSENGPTLTRVPHFFQDNMYMYTGKSWDLGKSIAKRTGPSVFCFHPVHIALNSQNMAQYENTKREMNISSVDKNDLPPIDHSQPGAGKFFRDLTEYASTTAALTLDEYCEAWRSGKADG